MGQRQIFVETLVRGDLDVLWHRTQDAAQHTRWDVRFHEISDVTEQRDDAPRAFRYALHLPGRTIAGTGTSLGERRRADGTCTSALRFGSPDPLSLIREGSGWWRYLPTDDGVRFLTGYDYEPGWGALGRVVDRLGFRWLLGWGTAWSFDRLRLWVEDDVPPEGALRLGLLDAGGRLALVVAGASAVVARRSTARGRAASLVAAIAAVGVAVRAPALPGAPRASRTLRRPPDPLGRRAPSSLSRLAAPGATEEVSP